MHSHVDSPWMARQNERMEVQRPSVTVVQPSTRTAKTVVTVANPVAGAAKPSVASEESLMRLGLFAGEFPQGPSLIVEICPGWPEISRFSGRLKSLKTDSKALKTERCTECLLDVAQRATSSQVLKKVCPCYGLGHP